MKKIKNSNVTMSVRIPPRDTPEITADEKKQLVAFFVALMDLDQEKNVMKGSIYGKSNK